MNKNEKNHYTSELKIFFRGFYSEFLKAVKESPALYFKPLKILFTKNQKKDS